MICPSIDLKDSLITMKNSNFYGYTGTKESLSFINITGRGSQALLDNCTFKENFIVSNFSDGIIVSNSTFQSYRHQVNSVITAYSSVVTLAGNVNFSNSIIEVHTSIHISGTAIFLRTTHPELKSSLNITTHATVYFVNLTNKNHHKNFNGGAVYGENGVISIGAKAKVVFMQNVDIYFGGAVLLNPGMMIVGVESNVVFAYNKAIGYSGGAIWLRNGALNINTNASLIFSHNHAGWFGGALHLDHGELIINILIQA